MAWKNLYNEVEFLTQHPEVALAISESNTPVPGYLFGEINALTYIDYGNNCKPLVNLLVSRLEVNAPIVSMKVLKLLIYLVKNGHTEMVEEVKFHEIALKESMGFHGPPDDLHGKTFYESIRKMARELLEYVFSEDKTHENISPPCQSELTGYGSSGSSKNLQGFGFSIKTQKSVTEKVSEGITNFVEKLLPSNDKTLNSAEVTHLSEALPQYKPMIINKSVPTCEEIPSESRSSVVQMPPPTIRTKKKTKVYKPGRPGGGWDDSEDEDEEDLIPEIVPEDVIEKSCTSVDSVDFSKIELKEIAIDWIDERKIVDEFTVNEELSKLNSSTILTLSKRCSLLNCDKVLCFLVEKFSEKVENIQLRALIFVEYLLFHDIISLESMSSIILPSVKELSTKGDDIPASVKIKARKVGLIIENLNKVYQRRHPKQFVETSISCKS
ncbi:AP-4 complex accessory subunit tepsin [Caerostris extrusa]|uniref:AP-4 complex accessory subunit tepsin n=1 Tax=Caerostris extrusa TaxID=172846 RepID=A0AAV4XMY6_CAEEX|nr:AP-4 complex accessory subunit tepsin [Caerostris extrusa]